MTDFAPSFNVSWDSSPEPSAPAPAPAPAPKPKLDAFGVDEAFASYKPSFSTEPVRQELIRPPPVPPVDNLGETAAARIFGEFCQQKFGFTPDFHQK